MAVYEYHCSNGHESEARGEYDMPSPPCPDCGEPTERESVYAIPFIMGGATSVPLDDRRINLSKFTEAASELEYKHQKHEEIVQHKVDNPNYFHEGMRRAKQVLAGTRPPPTEF